MDIVIGAYVCLTCTSYLHLCPYLLSSPHGMRLPVGPSPGWELEDRDNDTPNGSSSSPLHSVADRYVHLSSDAYHEINHLIATVLSSYNPSDNVDICLAYPLKIRF